MKVQGACHCGQVSYEAEIDPASVTLCNCTDCQMVTGSAFRVNVPAPRAGFRFLGGQLTTYVKTADNGTQRAHSFCRNCGTPVYSCAVTEEPPRYSLRVGCLEQRHELQPTKRIWCKSALDWAQNVSAIAGREAQ